MRNKYDVNIQKKIIESLHVVTYKNEYIKNHTCCKRRCSFISC